MLFRTLFAGVFCLVFARAEAQVTASKGWEVFFSGNSGGEDRIEDVLIDNGQIVAVGRAYKDDDETVMLVKYSTSGQQVWAKSWSIDGLDLYPYYLQKGGNGNYHVFGYADSEEYFVAQFDLNGAFLNVKVLNFGSVNFAAINDFKALPGGAFIFAGESSDGPHLWKVDQNLDLVWEKPLQFSFPQGIFKDAVFSIDVAPDGGFYLLSRGTSIISNTSADDVIVAKTDAQGILLWNKVFGGTKGDYISDSYDNQVRSRIVAHPDGGFAFECNTRSLEFAAAGVSSLNEVLVVKGDANGNQKWWRTSGGGAPNANGLAVKPNGNILIYGKGGTSPSNPFASPNDQSDRAYIFEVSNSNGQIVWGTSFGGQSYDFTRSVAVLDNARLFAGGSNDDRAWLFAVNISGVSAASETGGHAESLAVSPNPVSDQLSLAVPEGFSGTARVLDFRGTVVLEKSLRNAAPEISLDLGQLPAGVFQIVLIDAASARLRTGRFLKANN